MTSQINFILVLSLPMDLVNKMSHFYILKPIQLMKVLLLIFILKPTNKCQYLHFSSFHPDHTESSVIYRQDLRINGIFTLASNFNRHAKKMKLRFAIRGYPDWLINREMGKVKRKSNDKSIRRRTEKLPNFLSNN